MTCQYNSKHNAEGVVNFPLDSSDYVCSCEGGLFVYLLVDLPDTSRFTCCVGGIHTTGGEGLVYDDNTKNIPNCTCDDCEYFGSINMGREDIRHYHFPYSLKRKGKRRLDDHRYFFSRHYRAAVILGSTDWSGVDDEGYWSCTYDDLNAKGKTLYDSMAVVYGKDNLHLQTWLDT